MHFKFPAWFGVEKQKKKEKKRSSRISGAFFRTQEAQLLSLQQDDESTGTLGCSICHSETADTESISTAAPHISWKSTNRESFYHNQPLVVLSDDDRRNFNDQAAALAKVLSRKLPTTCSYYSSNHVMVNLERRHRHIAPLKRLAELDALARQHAQAMAAADAVFHSDPSSLLVVQHSTTTTPNIMGENVAAGQSIRDIHATMMHDSSHTVNILQRRYTHMGMGTASAGNSDGETKLYLCQLFQG